MNKKTINSLSGDDKKYLQIIDDQMELLSLMMGEGPVSHIEFEKPIREDDIASPFMDLRLKMFSRTSAVKTTKS